MAVVIGFSNLVSFLPDELASSWIWVRIFSGVSFLQPMVLSHPVRYEPLFYFGVLLGGKVGG